MAEHVHSRRECDRIAKVKLISPEGIEHERSIGAWCTDTEEIVRAHTARHWPGYTIVSVEITPVYILSQKLRDDMNK